jgi:hypothetical protein
MGTVGLLKNFKKERFEIAARFFESALRICYNHGLWHTDELCRISLKEKGSCHAQPKRLHAYRTPGCYRSDRRTNGHSDARSQGRQRIGA